MYFSSHDQFECCGCGGCRQVCPVSCISMTQMDDGFFYPEINQAICIHCDKCMDVCPFHQSNKALRACRSRDCFYGWHKNDVIRMQSTSGGAFSALAELFLENCGSFVYGALYDENWRVYHSGVNSRHRLDRLRQSKYIQSDLGDCYREIKDKLKHNRKVLFCGTPCQVNGLLLFLGKDDNNLLSVEFICHGVTSPAIFKTYIKHLEKNHCARVTKFRFRDKVTTGNILSLGHTTIDFENGKRQSSECNLYLRGYISGLMQRKSCEKCPYASPYRSADITLGDFWGIEGIIPELEDEAQKGISLILGNTEKGHVFCETLSGKMHLIRTEVAYAFNGINKQLEKPVQSHKKKQQFQNDLKKLGMPLALAKALGLRYMLLMYYEWCVRRVKAYLPSNIYRWMVKFKRMLSTIMCTDR